MNSTLFFDLCSVTSGNIIGTVTAHCHITTKVIQLQGSKIVAGCKAPIWFFNEVLKSTFEREEKARKDTIDQTNKNIENLGSELDCRSCDKKYKTANGLQKHIEAKHANLKCQPDDSSHRKRNLSVLHIDIEDDEGVLPMLEEIPQLLL